MKCQNCGKNEVNFRYKSSVNGAITETHLCSECAAEAGHDAALMATLENAIDEIFSFGNSYEKMNKISGFVPVVLPMMNAGMVLPLRLRPAPKEKHTQQSSTGCEYCAETKKNMDVEVDENLSKLRELNALLREAIEKEEFEKAAELRDEIKKYKIKA